MHKAQRLINHVALVLDGSGSMAGLSKKVIEAADEQVRQLAMRSEQLQQETRISIYRFSGERSTPLSKKVECLIFDMDVMRSPSIEELYGRPDGGTPLIDAVIKSQTDLATTSQLYGDHAFLTLVLTDGDENTSNTNWYDLSQFIAAAKENWTLGFFVPNQQGVTTLHRAGIDKGSISVWDATSAQGMLDAGKKIHSTVDAYMTGRSQGLRGTKSLFTTAATGADKVNAKTVAMTMKPMDRSSYSLHDVHQRQQIGDFVNDTLKLGPYYIGKGFYQFMKPETIQGDKALIVVNKLTGQAYEGVNARSLIGLTPGVEAKVKPAENPEWDIYVQSKAINRKLIPGTKMLLLK